MTLKTIKQVIAFKDAEIAELKLQLAEAAAVMHTAGIKEFEAAAEKRGMEKALGLVIELQRGEFVCRKCGLRKDGDGPKGDF